MIEEIRGAGRRRGRGQRTLSNKAAKGGSWLYGLPLIRSLRRLREWMGPRTPWPPRSPIARDLHPTDENLPAGTPDLGHPQYRS